MKCGVVTGMLIGGAIGAAAAMALYPRYRTKLNCMLKKSKKCVCDKIDQMIM